MKTFCLIGDSIPHNAAKYVKLKKPFINWEEELSKLQAMNVNIYAI